MGREKAQTYTEKISHKIGVKRRTESGGSSVDFSENTGTRRKGSEREL